MVEALTDGGLHPQVSEPPDPLAFRRFRDATLARTRSVCTSVNGGSAIGSAVGRMPASMIASCRRQAAGATSLDACMMQPSTTDHERAGKRPRLRRGFRAPELLRSTTGSPVRR